MGIEIRELVIRAVQGGEDKKEGNISVKQDEFFDALDEKHLQMAIKLKKQILKECQEQMERLLRQQREK